MIWNILNLPKSASSENRAKVVSGETFAEEIRCVTSGSNQPSQHDEPKNRDVVIPEGSVEKSWM